MKTPYMLTATLAALMLVQSVLGLLFQERYRDLDWIRAAWFGNDWVTLTIAVPLLLIGLALAARSSVGGLLLWLGMIGYASYNYAYYLLGAALNVFFPLYVVAVVLSVLILVLALSRVDVHDVAGAFRPTTPVRIVGGYLAFVGIGLASAWIGIWAAYVFVGRPTPVEPEAFKLVAALDLSIMVTVLALAGCLLWRRDPWGFILGAIAGIQGSLYLLVLAVNSIIAVNRGTAAAPGELPMWGTLTAFTTAATLLLLLNIRTDRRVGREIPSPA